jgi:hypothetical protein
MMAQGVGVRLSVLAGLVWVSSALPGCASRGDGARGEGSTDSRGAEPERVVQRMAPASPLSGATSGRAAGAPNGAASGTANGAASGTANGAASGTANGAASGAANGAVPNPEPAKGENPSALSGATARNSIPSGALESVRASRPSGAESISPKHLEAELNRLEAEIGN